MKGKRFLVGFAVMAITVSGGAMANEIYKWTDENGNVHYEDRPSGAATEQIVALSYNRTNRGAVQQRVQARLDSQSARQEARNAAADEAKTAEEKAAEAEESQKMCDDYRGRLETYVQAPRLYRKDDNGERVYLNEQEALDARKRIEKLIAENCGS